MYNLPYFKEPDQARVEQFMLDHPFAVLCGTGADGIPVATQVPFLIRKEQDRLFLRGHMMKQTDHQKAFTANSNVLAVFTGPHTYVSASWYTNPLQGSTWNYITVHAKGVLRFLEEEDLYDILKRTTSHFENNPNSPSLFEHLPQDYVDRLIKAIVGFEIEVSEVNHVCKLSQNRDEPSFLNIIHHLENGNEDARTIAAEMKMRHQELYAQQKSLSV